MAERGSFRYPHSQASLKHTYFLCVSRGIVAFGFIFNDVKAEAAKEDTIEVNSVLANSLSLDRNLLTRASKKVIITINYPRGSRIPSDYYYKWNERSIILSNSKIK